MIKPMKARDVKPFLDWASLRPFAKVAQLTPAYRAEPKLDGCGVFVELGKVANTITSATRGINRSLNFPHLAAATMPAIKGTILAAELIAAGTSPGGLLSKSTGLMVANPGRAVAQQRNTGPARLFVFDAIEMMDGSIRDFPYTERRELLELVMQAWQREYPELPVHLVPSWPATEASVVRSLSEGYEGVVLKALTSKYVEGSRNSGWYKLKMDSTADLVITGYEPGKDANAGKVGSFEVSVLTDAGYIPVGHCGNFTQAFRDEVSAPDGSLRQEWYEKVVEVSAQGVGARGHLRHCLLKRVRPDKTPADCGPDQLEAMEKV